MMSFRLTTKIDHKYSSILFIVNIKFIPLDKMDLIFLSSKRDHLEEFEECLKVEKAIGYQNLRTKFKVLLFLDIVHV